MYLRKSRADLEAEARGDGETLSKHKKALLKVAKQNTLNIIEIKEEIVSGESIIHRPKMLELLKEIEEKKYDAILCMDMERLGRGNMQEQGLILETLRNSKTKIITPRKTYDLENEFDEEYSEFEAFMARKELKMITRRMQGGRVRSVEEGNYIGTYAPFGYDISKTSNGRTLIINEEQAEIVRLIFQFYTVERLGSEKIATKLNSLGFQTLKGKAWRGYSILNIIKNEVYAGKIQWKKTQSKKSKTPGKIKDTKTRPKNEWIEVKGKHEPIISQEQFDAAAQILKGKYHIPYHLINGVVNPLAGLVICGKCGNKMSRRPYGKQQPHLICHNTNCNCRSTMLSLVEQKILDALKDWLDNYEVKWPTQDDSEEIMDISTIKENSLKKLQVEKNNLQQQKNSLHDFLERGIYDEETFLERSQLLANKIHENEKLISSLKQEITDDQNKEVAQKKIVPELKKVLTIYNSIEEPKLKNDLLRSVLEKIVYEKEAHQKGADIKLVLYPKISTHV